MGLIARHLESTGIPTVIAGSARDIVEQCGVPRFLFTDFPLGNPMGVPYDSEMQKPITRMALDLAANASFSRTTVQTPFEWHDNEWRKKFMYVGDENRELLARAGRLRKLQQEKNRQ